jgi:tRNA(Ile)-lysidine synthase
LREWLQSQGQTWVEDPTNTDEKFTRNRIRARVLPALAEALPAFRETFARSATHAAQAQEVLNEVAAQDLAQVGVPPRIQALQQLSRARQALVLRHWLRQHHATTPSTAQLHELLDQVVACTTRAPCSWRNHCRRTPPSESASARRLAATAGGASPTWVPRLKAA